MQVRGACGGGGAASRRLAASVCTFDGSVPRPALPPCPFVINSCLLRRPCCQFCTGDDVCGICRMPFDGCPPEGELGAESGYRLGHKNSLRATKQGRNRESERLP